MLKYVKNYFDLGLFPSRINFGNKEDDSNKLRRIIWSFLLYFGVFAGVLSSHFMKSSNIDKGFNVKLILTSLIIATIIYPYVYKTAKFDKEQPNQIQLFLSFQNGFFWEVVSNNITI